MQEFSIPSPFNRRQTVLLSDEVLSILKRPSGLIETQWRLSDLVDVAFFPAAREIGGKSIDKPYGEVRLARNWAERRKGLYFNDHPLGVLFDFKHEAVAYELYELLKSKDSVKLQTPNHISQVETHRFVLTLESSHLIVTHRPYYGTLKQALDSGIVRDDHDAETRLNLKSISGLKVSSASNDKMSFGRLSGTLVVFTTALGANRSTFGNARNELALDFSKSEETKVRKFVQDFDDYMDRTEAGGVPHPHSAKSLVDELKELDVLRSSGVLTEEEFAAAKAKLLGN